MSGPRRGFILGKFLPPHRGHLFTCETAARMVERLTVLVCSIDAEPIPGELRAAWMRELLPGARVVHMHRDIPQEPADHPDFWAIWEAAVREHHPEPIDLVFGSDPYVFRLAETLGARAVLVDPEREAFPVSGSAIREDPAASWTFLPGPVRPWFQRRVCLLGPESSGKSSLAARLAERFATRHMPEYGRVYDAHYRRGDGWRPEDLVALATTHASMRAALAPHAGPLLVEDTDAVQTVVWAEYLLGAVPPALEAIVIAGRPADLYLLLSPDVPWRDDGTRYSGEPRTREWFFERLRARLESLGRRYRVLADDDWERREAEAVRAVAALRVAAARARPGQGE